MNSEAFALLDAWATNVLWSNAWDQRQSELANDALGATVRHAAETVPFYREAVHLTRFEDLRPIKRSDVAQHQLSFLSERIDIRRALQTCTSGTSGQPLTIVRDHASAYDYFCYSYRDIYTLIPQFAERLRSGELAVLLVNDNPKKVTSRSVNPAIKNSVVERRILGISRMHDIEVGRSVAGLKIPLLYGRPRALLRFVDALDGGALGIPQVGAILVSGENLYPDQRNALQAVFGCCVHNAYVSQEGGLVAAECAHQTGLHVFSKRCHVEILTREGCLEPRGRGEIVISTLQNWAMPLLRYRTGDSGTLVEDVCKCGFSGLSLTSFCGRDSDVFVRDGDVFNPSVFNSLFEALPVNRFQVVQEELNRFIVNWAHRLDGRQAADVAAAIFSGVKAHFQNARIELVQFPDQDGPDHKISRYVCRVPLPNKARPWKPKYSR